MELRILFQSIQQASKQTIPSKRKANVDKAWVEQEYEELAKLCEKKGSWLSMSVIVIIIARCYNIKADQLNLASEQRSDAHNRMINWNKWNSWNKIWEKAIYF